MRRRSRGSGRTRRLGRCDAKRQGAKPARRVPSLWFLESVSQGFDLLELVQAILTYAISAVCGLERFVPVRVMGVICGAIFIVLKWPTLITSARSIDGG